MKRSMKTLLLSGVAALLVMGTAAAPSMSYFTTFVSAQGSKLIQLEQVKTMPHEVFEDNKKEITIENTGDADCYVRVQAFCGDGVELTFESAADEEGDLWFNGGDGWYYYRKVLKRATAEADKITGTLTITIKRTEKDIDRDYNVVVVQEAAPVLFDADGKALPNGSAYEGWASRYKWRTQSTYVDESQTGGEGGDTEPGENETAPDNTPDNTEEQP